MTPDALAALHASAFTDFPRPWTAAEFASLLAGSGVVLAADAEGFALGRIAGPEAELLTVAVAPGARRQGLATRLIDRLCRAAATAGAEEMVLEVAVSNAAARALYARTGFTEVGRRLRYYARRAGPPVDALVLRRRLAREPSEFI